MAWTQFMDMHSGGGNKTGYEYIYIEADKDTATTVFCNMFDQHPDSAACSCCGNNFYVTESDTLEEATDYNRRWSKKSIEDYLEDEDIKVVYASEITEDFLKESGVEPYNAYEDDYYEEDGE